MKKKLNITIKCLIAFFLTVLVIIPNVVKSKASSYSYDFWKNVVPSAEGLAYSETYYADDIKDLDGNNLTDEEKITFDTLADLAVYGNHIYILDTMEHVSTTAVQAQTVGEHTYQQIEGMGNSVIYVLNQNFQKEQILNEFLITDEVKAKLQDYYNFYYENYQITSSEYLTSTELANFFDEGTTYQLTLTKGENELIVTDFVYAPYTYDEETKTGHYEDNDDLLELFIVNDDNTKTKIDFNKWQWVATSNNGEIVYKIVLDESLVTDVDQHLEAKISKCTTYGKAPYFAYSKDPTKSAIRLSKATGLTITEKYIYIADTGNSRVVRYDYQQNIVDGVYLTPEDSAFYQVKDNIKVMDSSETVFRPNKVAVDRTGRLYCIATGTYEGIMEFHTSGSFNRFLGKNEVVANPLKKLFSWFYSETQLDSLDKDLPPEFTNIAMDENGFLYATSHPDSDATTNANMVKMINTSGKDILKRNGYVTPDGDAVYLTASNIDGATIGMSNLVAITVSRNGNFTIADQRRGRLFTYDTEGNLLYITGDQPAGLGSSGLSSSIVNPVAIRYFYRDTVDEQGNPTTEETVLVLDAESKTILVFETTEFGKAVNTATELYLNGIVQDEYLLDENGNIALDAEGSPIVKQYGAETYWQQVVKMNTNYELAYLGIGKALLMRGEYKEAMSYFKLAHNATYYSKAYSEYRDQILSKNFSWIMTAIILLVVVFITLSYRSHLKKRNQALAVAQALNAEKAAALASHTLSSTTSEEEKKIDNSEQNSENDPPTNQKAKKINWKKIISKIKGFFHETIGFPLYILTHPVQGFNEFKTDKKGKMWVAIVILLAYVLMEILAYQYEGIIINKNNPHDFNSIRILIYGVIPPIVLAAANWSVTTLLDGKGKLKEIFMMICYSLLPVTLLGFLNIILSNVMTLDEAQFITLIKIVAWALTGYMVFMGLVVIHEYGMGKTIWSVLLTILATLIIAFIALLIFDLAQQMYGFVYSLYREIMLRFF